MQAPTAPLRAVFLRACDRPAQLGALLETLADYERRYGARRPYVVVDDSREPENARRNAALLASFARRTGAPTCHLDDAAWATAVDRWATAVPDARAALSFAVARRGPTGVRPGYGKGLNLATLLAAGARYVTFDEDHLLPLKQPQDAQDGIDPTCQTPMTRFFADVDSALAAGAELDDDPFDDALDLCGARLPTGARIVTLSHGHRGSSCTESSHWMYLLDGDSRQELWGPDEATYRRNLEGRSVWFGVRRAYRMTSANITPFAVDATRMLPPTMPYGRSEDLVFGVLTALAEPASMALHSNLTVGHRHGADRVRTASLHQPYDSVFNGFVVDAVHAVSRERAGDDPLAPFEQVARRLRGTAAASNRARAEALRDYVQRARGEWVPRLEAAREAAPQAPAYWDADLRSIIDVNRRALRHPPPLRFLDWPDAEPEDVPELARERLEGFADTLEAWPALWDHATIDCAAGLLDGDQI